MFYKGKSKVNIPLIDNHIHGSFGIDFNTASYEEIKFVLAELHKRNIKGILLIFKSIFPIKIKNVN